MTDLPGRLADYVTVAERIEAFYEKYPEGSLQSSIVTVDDERVVMTALAYRSGDDAHPGVGHAEEIRGSSPVNKTSALENCETSAWGRALAALGFEVKNGVASREEVRNAQAQEGRSDGPTSDKPSAKQIDFFIRLAKDKGAKADEEGNLRGYAEAKLTGGRGGSMSKAIDALKEDENAIERLRAGVKEWQATLTDLPADTFGLEDVTDEPGDGDDTKDIPF